MKIKKMLARKDVAVGLASVVSFAVGGTIAYLTTHKALDMKYKEIADAEIHQVREHYQVLRKEGPVYSDPVNAYEQIMLERGEDPVDLTKNNYTDLLKNLSEGGVPAAEYVSKATRDADGDLENAFGDLENAVAIVKSVFDAEEVDDPGEEVHGKYVRVNLNEEKDIYVISQPTFFANESDMTQTTISYFAEDDVYADEDDNVIDIVDLLIGTEATPYGYMSNGEDLVYIRNEALEVEYEVVRSHGSYQDEVLGGIK